MKIPRLVREELHSQEIDKTERQDKQVAGSDEIKILKHVFSVNKS